MLRNWIREQFQVGWSDAGLRKTLVRERIALKVLEVPRPRHEKTDHTTRNGRVRTLKRPVASVAPEGALRVPSRQASRDPRGKIY
jgi:hypothetical protein